MRSQGHVRRCQHRVGSPLDDNHSESGGGYRLTKERLVEMWRAGRLPLERLVSSRIRLDEIESAMDRLATGSELRQIVRFDEPA